MTSAGYKSSTVLTTPRILELAIIGAGFGGLGMAARARAAGIENFLVFESSSQPGGVWRDNHYPGAACDIPARLYWYGWDQQPDWTRVYASRNEIFGNLMDLIDRYSLSDQIETDNAVRSLRWVDALGYWHIITQQGQEYRARTVVSAVGQLGTLSYRDIQCRNQFEGVQMHSARWDHSVDLRGLTVAVIGTGASAAQIIPEVASQAEHLLVIQSSAAWVTPRNDRTYTIKEREEFQASSQVREYERARIFTEQEERFESFGLGSVALDEMEAQLRSRMREIVSDSELQRLLTPNYRLGCKRPIRSDDLLQVMTSDKVTVISDRVTSLYQDGLVTGGGERYPVDVIVYATGFDSMKFLNGIEIIGRAGKNLHKDAWADAPQAYLGITVPAFPNFFMVYGPNTNTNNSAIRLMDAQTNYILQALDYIQADKSVDVREEVQAEFDLLVQSDCADQTITSGCNSWYINAAGRVVTNWCSTVNSYLEATRIFNPADYRIMNLKDSQVLEPTRI